MPCANETIFTSIDSDDDDDGDGGNTDNDYANKEMERRKRKKKWHKLNMFDRYSGRLQCAKIVDKAECGE